MCRGTGLHAGTRGTRDGIHADVAVQQPVSSQRQQAQLDSRGEATWVGDVLGLSYLSLVDFRQTIDIIMVGRGKPEVLCQVDDTYILRHGVFLEELCTLAVAHTQEQHIDALQRHAVGELHVGLAKEAFVNICEKCLGIAGAVYESNLSFGVVQQQTDELTRRVACTTYDSYFYHLFSSL